MSSNYGTVTTNQPRPYQGFPYTNPTVTDVPTIDPSTQDPWANMPRKLIDTTRPTLDTRRQVADESGQPSTPDFVSETILYNPFEDTTINITPDRSPVTSPEDEHRSYAPSRSQAGGSRPNDLQLQVDPSVNRSTNFQPNEDSDTSDTSGDEAPRRYVPPIPQRSAGSPQSPTLSHYLNKSANVYEAQDDFSLAPIPVAEYREPPPAYTEVDRVHRAAPAPPTVTTEPPRTQVIIPMRVTEPPVVNNDRKYLKCPHCERQVHTLVIRESGVATHVAAWSFMLFCLMPLTIFIYCTKYFKYKNHYCPECNRLVGYEVPITCQGFVYAERQG